MNNITTEEYLFYQAIGHPYMGKVNGEIEVHSNSNYIEMYNFRNKTMVCHFLESSSITPIESENSASPYKEVQAFFYELQKHSSEFSKEFSRIYKEYKENIGEFYEKYQNDIVEWYSLVEVAGGMTKDWFLGEGLSTRIFSNDKIALAMKDSAGIHRNRMEFYDKVKREKKLKGMTYIKGGASFGLQGPFKAGIDPIEQFVGSCDVDISCLDGKKLHFEVYNKTSFNSFLYHIETAFNKILTKLNVSTIPEWQWNRETFKYMGNMEQYYIWDEPVNTSLLCENII